MNILCLGDVVGANGCDALRQRLPTLKKLKNIKLTIVNGENSAEGNGITPSSAEHLFTSGVDVITGGNHTFRRKEIHNMLEENQFLLRPANTPSSHGKGLCIVDMGFVIAAVINLTGIAYMDAGDNPYQAADRLIEQAKLSGARVIVVDFHAEATGEKKALAYYLDGRVSALVGTHTHVQTADLQILPKGTGYITDLGMCGPKHSVLGIKPEIAIAKMKDDEQIRFRNADGESIINGCIFEVDEASGKTVSAELIQINIDKR